MSPPAEPPRGIRVVAGILVILGALLVLGGLGGFLLRFPLAAALRSASPDLSPWRLGWGPSGMAVYWDRMTAFVALGLPVGLLGLWLTTRRLPDGRPDRSGILASLALQGVNGLLGLAVFTVSWPGACAWFAHRPDGGAASEAFLSVLLWGGYVTAAAMAVAVVAGGIVAARTLLHAPAEN